MGGVLRKTTLWELQVTMLLALLALLARPVPLVPLALLGRSEHCNLPGNQPPRSRDSCHLLVYTANNNEFLTSDYPRGDFREDFRGLLRDDL